VRVQELSFFGLFLAAVQLEASRLSIFQKKQATLLTNCTASAVHVKGGLGKREIARPFGWRWHPSRKKFTLLYQDKNMPREKGLREEKNRLLAKATSDTASREGDFLDEPHKCQRKEP